MNTSHPNKVNSADKCVSNALRHSAVLLGIALLISGLCYAQASADPWLILSTGEKGSINAHTARSDLARSFGASKVADKDVDVGEGETEPGTLVFPNDPERLIEILWRDPDKKTEPKSATISGKKSRWHAVHGISLGTSLSELERLNGRPFHLAGFDWDYSGTILSWDGGVLARELDGGDGRVILRLDSDRANVTQQERSQVEGDSEFSSQHPVMHKLDPDVYQMIWVFPTQAKVGRKATRQ